ncbi:MAG: phage major capsid protein [Bacillota bacterium]|nr:MAG: phage major capsid protein [Bacillota bacterium]
MRIDEINNRLAAIECEIDASTGDTLTALEAEVAELTQERTRIMDEINARQQLRSSIAAGLKVGKTIERFEEESTVENRTFAPDSVEYREAYLLNLQGRDLTAEQRTALSASGVIPTQTMNQIISYLEDNPILSRVDMTYIPGNVTYPVEGTNADAAWVAMGTAATDSADTITTITLAAYKLIKTVEITADIEAMAIDAFEAWLVNSLAAKLEKALDAAVFNGTGTNQATGLATTISTETGTFTKAKAKYSDLITIIAALPSAYAKNAIFAMPRKLFFTDVIGIEDTTGQPVCHMDVESPAKYNILGYHVVLDDNVPADNIFFGDFKAYKLNIAKAPQVTSDDSVAFRTGSRVYRAMALADGKLAVSDAFVRFKRASA